MVIDNIIGGEGGGGGVGWHVFVYFARDSTPAKPINIISIMSGEGDDALEQYFQRGDEGRELLDEG